MIKMLQYKMYPAGELRCPTTALVKKSGLSEQFDLESPDIEYVLGVSGTSIKVMGTAVLPLTIGKLEVQQKFYIFEKFRQPLILGIDFLTEQGAKVDFENYTLEVQSGMTMAELYANPQKLSLARTINTR